MAPKCSLKERTLSRYPKVRWSRSWTGVTSRSQRSTSKSRHGPHILNKSYCSWKFSQSFPIFSNLNRLCFWLIYFDVFAIFPSSFTVVLSFVLRAFFYWQRKETLYCRFAIYRNPLGGITSMEAELHLDNKVKHQFSSFSLTAVCSQSGLLDSIRPSILLR